MKRYIHSSSLLVPIPLLLYVISSLSSVIAFQPLVSVGRHSCAEPVSIQLLQSSSSNNNGNGGGVEVVSLDILGNDHERVGNEIALSVQSMLDNEWMPQTIHMKMGQSVKQSYVKVRTGTTNPNDGSKELGEQIADDMIIMTIMTTVADDLITNWKEYDADAFVNAWDVANYVSDYLTTKINGNTAACACATKIY